MKSIEEIDKIIQEHEKRLAAIESLVSKRKVPTVKNNMASLPDHILGLRESGFFRDPQTEGETHAKLQPIYHCEKDRVGVALTRLATRKQLRRASKVLNGKKYHAYVW